MTLTALITGGAAGIGLATARKLVANGAHVVIVDLDGDAGRSAAEAMAPGSSRRTWPIRNRSVQRSRRPSVRPDRSIWSTSTRGS